MAVNTSVGGPDDGREKYEPRGDTEGTQESDLNDLIGIFDDRNEALNVLFRHLAEHRPEIDDAIPALQMRAETVASCFNDILVKLADAHELGSVEFVRAVSTLWVEVDHRRVDLYKNLGPNAKIQKIGRDDLEEVIRRAYEDSEEGEDVVGNLANAFGVSLVSDGDDLLSSWRADAYVASMGG